MTRTNATTPRYWSYEESKTSARGGAARVAGRRRDPLDDRVEHGLDALRRSSQRRAAPARGRRRPARRARAAAPSGSACGRSILLTTGSNSRLFSIARYAFATVCASTPWAASTTSTAPSHAWSERETSYVKSTCPGVSIRLRTCPFHSTRTACALIVIPRSRSSSIESSTCARMSRPVTVFVTSRMRSASVDFPWSMWAMIEKFRIRSWSIGD